MLWSVVTVDNADSYDNDEYIYSIATKGFEKHDSFPHDLVYDGLIANMFTPKKGVRINITDISTVASAMSSKTGSLFFLFFFIFSFLLFFFLFFFCGLWLELRRPQSWWDFCICDYWSSHILFWGDSIYIKMCFLCPECWPDTGGQNHTLSAWWAGHCQGEGEYNFVTGCRIAGVFM